jgi:hypothetical protein
MHTCGGGRIDRMSMMKYENKYLLAITLGSAFNSALPNTREEGAKNPVRNCKII